MFPLISTFTSLVSSNVPLFKHIHRRGGLSGRGINRTKAKDLPTRLFFLLSMGVGVLPFKHVNAPQKNLLIWHEHPLAASIDSS